MHIAIDDTYGPHSNTNSKFVTGERRSHVAVVFPESDVDRTRNFIEGFLIAIKSFDVHVDEFHFADIYQRRGMWAAASDGKNLDIFSAFAEIYRDAKWPVIVQTIDQRTFADHGQGVPKLKTQTINLDKREHVSLLMLMKQGLPPHLPKSNEQVRLYVDEGIGKPGQKIESVLLPKSKGPISGVYESSTREPLLQIADFLAFSINRCTHLAMKTKRSKLDMWFLDLVGGMEINSPQLKYVELPRDFDVSDFDELHLQDRRSKGIE